MYVYTSICVYIHTHTHIYIYVRAYVYTCVCVYIYECIHGDVPGLHRVMQSYIGYACYETLNTKACVFSLR